MLPVSPRPDALNAITSHLTHAELDAAQVTSSLSSARLQPFALDDAPAPKSEVTATRSTAPSSDADALERDRQWLEAERRRLELEREKLERERLELEQKKLADERPSARLRRPSGRLAPAPAADSAPSADRAAGGGPTSAPSPPAATPRPSALTAASPASPTGSSRQRAVTMLLAYLRQQGLLPEPVLAEAEARGELRLGKFVVTDWVSHGGMGAVFRARDPMFERDVTIKLFPVASEEQAATYGADFEALARLNHANTVNLIECGAVGGTFYYVTEFVRGISLEQRLRGPPLTEEEAWHVVEEVTAAMILAETQGAIHGDLRPANILVESGVSGAIHKLWGFRRAGSPLPSSIYASPEQALGRPLDVRSDMYSLGLTVFHLVTGRMPFEGATPGETLARRVSLDLPDLRSLRPDVSAGLARVVGDLGARERERRPASWHVVPHLIAQARAAVWTRPAQPSTEAPSVVPSNEEGPRRPSTRRLRVPADAQASAPAPALTDQPKRPSTRRLKPTSARIAAHERSSAAYVIGALACVGLFVLAVVLAQRDGTRSSTTAPDAGLARESNAAMEPPARNERARPEDPPAPSKTSPKEEALGVLAEADRLEGEGREPSAYACLDAALRRAIDPEALRNLNEAKRGLLFRCRARLQADCAEVERLARAGEIAEAKRVLGQTVAHMPQPLRNEVANAVSRINAAIRETRPTSAPNAEKRESPEPTRRNQDLASLARLREVVDKALAGLDPAAARAALAQLGNLSEQDLRDEVALERRRIDAVETILELATGALRAQVGKTVELGLRKGAAAQGRLLRFDEGKLTVAVAAGAERDIEMRELAVETVLRIARLGGRVDSDAFAFGRGVILACSGDRKGALAALDQATSVPEAKVLKERLRTEEAASGPTVASTERQAPKPSVERTREPAKPPGPGTVTFGDGGDSEREISWMDDTSGAVPWERAYALETEHYVIKTNIQQRYARRYASFVEALFPRYARIFSAFGDSSRYTKSKLFIYANQDEFIDHERLPNALGFYEPSTKRVAMFHGPWNNMRADTLGTLAHEATHQFENFVVRQLDHAPVFLIEGLATFFEATEILENDDVLVGKIPLDRLRGLQRAIRANDYVHLRELIRTPRIRFTASHYAHAWGLVHLLVYGPEKKKFQRLLDWFWEQCSKRPTKAEDFEDGLKEIGYTTQKLEGAWKEWVLGLDPKRDPAVLEYERQRQTKKSKQ